MTHFMLSALAITEYMYVMALGFDSIFIFPQQPLQFPEGVIVLL